MRKASLLPVGAAALALWGCGGGNGSSASGPTANPLTAGRAALSSLAANTTPTSAQTLQSAFDLFTKALQENPNSTEAHFGAAVCLMGSAAQQIDGVGGIPTVPPILTPLASVKPEGQGGSGSSPGNPGNGGSGFVLPSPPSDGDLPPAPPGSTEPGKPIEPTHTLGLFWFLDRGLSNPNTLLNMLSPISDLRLGLIPYYGYSGDAQDVARRQKLLTDLGTVAQHLQTVEADASFTLTLPAPDQNGQPVTIGLPEVYLFDAYVQSLRVSTALSLAYVRDPGNNSLLPPSPPTVGTGSTGSGTTTSSMPPPPPFFSGGGREVNEPTEPPSPFLALDKNKDGKLTPDEYLPASPFLTLRDAAYFQTAKDAMTAIVDRETKGIAGILARPTTEPFLLPNSPDVAKAVANIRDNVLPLITQATTGPVTLTVPRYQAIPLVAIGGGSTLVHPVAASNELFTLRPQSGGDLPPTPPGVKNLRLVLNIAAWFAHPPADLKPLAPTYLLNSFGFPNFDKTTYPDPTFGGLFPEGIPADLRL